MDQDSISFRMVQEVRKRLPKEMTVSVKDKNTGQLRVECDIVVAKRIQKEIYDCKSFEKVIDKNEQDIVEKLRGEVQKYRLGHLGRWHNVVYPKTILSLNKKIPSTKLD